MEKRELSYPVDGNLIGTAIMEISQKIKNRDTVWSSNSIHWYTCKKMKTLIPKHIWTPMFIAAFFTIAKAWEQSKSPSTNERIEKMYNRHTHTHKHTHTHTHTDTPRHTHRHTHRQKHTQIHIDTHTDAHTHRDIIQLQQKNKLCHFQQHGWV